ncbi:MAG: InlB B-repeat-containing protein [Acholeplasmatales bacterium]|jgi:uncharacterized repeat protein (TIGR02543 family)|nr:InlB B-repeat-containing protein [Acholeplasmatales bacterium]
MKALKIVIMVLVAVFSVALITSVGVGVFLNLPDSKDKIVSYDYSISINGNGTTEGTKEGKYQAGNIINVYATPLENYRFVSYQIDNKVVSTTKDYHFVISKNTVLKVNFELKEVYHTIIFESNGGSNVQSKVIQKGQPLQEVASPTKSHSTFIGWYYDSLFEVPVSWPFNVSSDLVLYAKWNTEKYNISWVSNGIVLKVDSVEYGTLPVYNGVTPIKENTLEYSYVFSGWNEEIVAVSENATYNASFTAHIREYEITLIVEGTASVVNAAYGSLPVFETPTKESSAEYSYTFVSWTPQVVTVSADATYTAVFESHIREYTVTFESNGGSNVSSITVNYGVAIERPENPTKEGYSFVNWYYDINYENEVSWLESFIVTENKTLYALWSEFIIVSYKVTLVYNNGLPDGIVYINEDSFLSLPSVPLYNGHYFEGWFIDILLTNEVVWGTENQILIDEETTLYASWSVIYYTISFDVDGSIDTIVLEYGETPTHAAVTKGSDNFRDYVFSAWNPSISSVTGDTTYTAIFETIVKDYNWWVNGEGSSNGWDYENDEYVENTGVGDAKIYLKGIESGDFSVETSVYIGDNTVSDSFPKAGFVLEGDSKQVFFFIDVNSSRDNLWGNYVFKNGLTWDWEYYGRSFVYLQNASYNKTYKTMEIIRLGSAIYLVSDGKVVQYAENIFGENEDVSLYYLGFNLNLRLKDTHVYLDSDFESRIASKKIGRKEGSVIDGNISDWTSSNLSNPVYLAAGGIKGGNIYAYMALDGVYIAYDINHSVLITSNSIWWQSTNAEFRLEDGAQRWASANGQYSRWEEGGLRDVGYASFVTTGSAGAYHTTVEIIIPYCFIDGFSFDSDFIRAGFAWKTLGDASTLNAWHADDPDFWFLPEADPGLRNRFITKNGMSYASDKVIDGNIDDWDAELKSHQSALLNNNIVNAYLGADGIYGYFITSSQVNLYINTGDWWTNPNIEFWLNDNDPHARIMIYNGNLAASGVVSEAAYTYNGEYLIIEWFSAYAVINGIDNESLECNFRIGATGGGINGFWIIDPNIKILSTGLELFSVSFKNGETVLESASVSYGTVPTYTGIAPTKESTAEYGYTFSSWSPSLSSVKSNTVYNATFTAFTNSYTVTFESNGGSAVTSVTALYGSTLTRPENPTNGELYFVNWYLDDETFLTEVLWLPSYLITGNVTFYAKWSISNPVQYTVTLALNNPSGTASTLVGENEYFYLPEVDPVYEGHNFIGWFFDLLIEVPVDWTEAGKIQITADTILYAKWELTTYTITWNINGATTDESYQYGNTPSHSTPTKLPDTFLEYSFNSWDPEIINVTSSTTYTAVFTSAVKNYTWQVGEGSNTTAGWSYQNNEYVENTGVGDAKIYLKGIESGDFSVQTSVYIGANTASDSFPKAGFVLEVGSNQVFFFIDINTERNNLWGNYASGNGTTWDFQVDNRLFVNLGSTSYNANYKTLEIVRLGTAIYFISDGNVVQYAENIFGASDNVKLYFLGFNLNIRLKDTVCYVGSDLTTRLNSKKIYNKTNIIIDGDVYMDWTINQTRNQVNIPSSADRYVNIYANINTDGIYIGFIAWHNVYVNNSNEWFNNTNFEFQLEDNKQYYVNSKGTYSRLEGGTGGIGYAKMVTSDLGPSRYLTNGEVFIPWSLTPWDYSAGMKIGAGFAWKTPGDNEGVDGWQGATSDYWYNPEAAPSDATKTKFITENGFYEGTAFVIDADNSDWGGYGADVINSEGRVINVLAALGDDGLYVHVTMTLPNGVNLFNYSSHWWENPNIEFWVDGIEPHGRIFIAKASLYFSGKVTAASFMYSGVPKRLDFEFFYYIQNPESHVTLKLGSNSVDGGWFEKTYSVNSEGLSYIL